VTGGVVTVVEAQGGTTVVQAISTLPTLRLVSSNLTTGTAVVRAPAGGTETVVTYANVVPGAEIKVCKQAAADSTQLNGQPFSFTINGGAAFTVDAGPFGSPNCSGLVNYAAGTNVTVRELQPAANVSVSAIDVTQPPATNVVPNLSTRTVKLTVGSGVNIVTYTNQVDVSALKGYIEICKYGEDNFVYGSSFSFTITDAAGLTYGPYSVLTGQCTAAIEVTSGPATITEAAKAPFYLWSVSSNRLISQNDTNGTASVNVVAGDPSTETLALFYNETELGYIKVCKALDSANSDALAGTTFVFNWSVALSTGGTLIGTTYVVANTFENGPACVFLNSGIGLPLGSIVTISEVGQVNVVSTSTQTVTVPGTWSPDGIPGNNITSVTFTNQAEGTIEICKDAADSETLGNGSNPFVFSISDGSFSASVTVDAGKCSAPILVPAGSAIVTEGASTNFHLVSVTATGPTSDNRVISGFNPVLVSVPFSGTTLYGNETLVTFTNAVNTGQFKICKTSSSSLLSGESFVFNWNYILNGTTITGTITLQPGQCGYLNGSGQGLSPAIPVVDNNGNTVIVNVYGDTDTGTWVLNTNYYINSITHAGSGPFYGYPATSHSYFTIGQGVNSVTYDNEPCASGGCPYPPLV
jgi:hypothetical protein